MCKFTFSPISCSSLLWFLSNLTLISLFALSKSIRSAPHLKQLQIVTFCFLLSFIGRMLNVDTMSSCNWIMRIRFIILMYLSFFFWEWILGHWQDNNEHFRLSDLVAAPFFSLSFVYHFLTSSVSLTPSLFTILLSFSSSGLCVCGSCCSCCCRWQFCNQLKRAEKYAMLSEREREENWEKERKKHIE